MCRYYKTNVLGFYFGNKLAIVANDAESVKESLFNTDMDGKPKMLLAKMRDPNFNFRGNLSTNFILFGLRVSIYIILKKLLLISKKEYFLLMDHFGSNKDVTHYVI